MTRWPALQGLNILLCIFFTLLLLSACAIDTPSTAVNAASTSGRPVPPLQPARFADYQSHTAMPERIEIPAIDLDTSIAELGWRAAIDPAGRVFNNWDVAAYEAGWHVNSDKLGEGGNVVLSGHNNILGAVFRELDQLETGDVATVWSGGRRYNFEIGTVLVVPELNATHEQRLENAKWIGEFGDDRLTLVTCWPRDGNSHRIIAIGHAVDGDASR